MIPSKQTVLAHHLSLSAFNADLRLQATVNCSVSGWLLPADKML